LGLLLVACFFSAQPVQSQCLLIPIPLEERVYKSPNVFEGEIVESEGFWNPEHQMIHTAFKVKVTKVFKGQITDPFVVVYTEGGKVEHQGLVVNPSLNLMVGDKGVFIGSPSNMPTPYPDLETYYPYGTANGFIRYDLITNSASEAFYKYKNINDDLYPQLERLCRQKAQIVAKLARPRIATGEQVMVPPTNITFLPASITAGTFSRLTITGLNFGPGTGPSEVRFRNADDGGVTTVNIPAANPHVISWTNTQIIVIVPQRAGTGTIQIVNELGEVGTSAATLNVSYAIINSGSPAVVRHQVLTDENYAGGHTLSLNTTTGFAGNVPAVDAFRRALETWRCATFVNFPISSQTTTANYTNTADTINSVCFDGPTTITALGICFSAWSLPPGCQITPGGATGIKTSIDLVFRHPTTNPPPQPWSFSVVTPPGINWFDFQSVALHELGHGHELAHVIDPAFEVMNFNIANGQTRRSIAGGATNAGLFVMTRSTDVTQMLACNQFPHQAIDPATCTQTTPNPPSCGITASITSGCSPLTVNFTGDIPIPGNIPSGWMWNIDYNLDGNPTGPPQRIHQEYYTRNITHTFTAPGTYVVRLHTGSGNSLTSYCYSNVTINVTGTFVANITPMNPPPACGSVLLTATNDINFTYQWRRNGVDIPGATANTYNATISGAYTVFITQGGCSQVIGPSNVTINPATVGGSLSGGGAVCANGNSGTMTLTGYVGNILRWEMSTDNFTTITNIANTTPTHNYFNITVPTQYRVVVQSPGCLQQFSTVASFTVNPPTIPGTITPSIVNGCAGQISGTLTLTGQQGNILRWESSTNGFGTIQTIPNTSPNQSYAGLMQTTQFRAVVQNPGCAVLTSNVVTVNVTPTPGSLGSITGPTVICQNVVGTYQVMSVPNVIYDWSISPAGPLLLPSGNTIQINFSTGQPGNYTLTITPRIGVCVGPPSTLNIYVQAVPVTPSMIHVPAQCIGQSGFYYVDPIPGASTYTWSNSCGWTGTSTSNFIFLFANTPTNCLVSVQAQGQCGTTGVVTASVTPIDIPLQPSPITGNPTVCNDRVEHYTVINTPGIIYTWSGLPQGAFISNGQGTNDVEVNWGSASPGTYTLTVTPSNPCGQGQTQSINVTLVGIPAQPSPIVGPPTTCQNSPQTYAVNFVPGVTYTWSVIPSGPSLIPSNNTVAFNSATSGTYLLTVTQNSLCGSSQPQFFTVVVEAQRIANAGANRTVCSANTVLVGSPSGGQWTCVTCPGVNLQPAGNFGIVSGMRPNSANIFRYAFAQTGACPGSESFITVINGMANAGTISGPNSVCAGGNITLTLNGNAGNVVRWEVSEDNGVTFTSLNNPTTVLNYNVTTNAQFRVVVNTGGICPNALSQSYPVTVNQQVNAQVQDVNITVCSDFTNIFALNQGQNLEGVWSFVSGPMTANIVSTGVMGLVSGMTLPGVYRFRWQIDNPPPCAPTFAETFITRLAPTTPAFGGNDQTICDNQITLTGNVPQNGTGSWSLLSAPNTPILSGSGTIIQATGMIPGRYVFEYKIVNPPCQPSVDQVIITVVGDQQPANAGTDRTVCGNTATLTGSNPAPGTGTWSFVSGPANATITTMGRDGMISGMTQPGDYIFRWTVNSPQCGMTSDIVILTRLQSGGIAQVARASVNVCGQAGTTISALPFGNGTANWSFITGPSVALINTAGLDGIITGMTLPGIYTFRWTVTSNCGTSTADVQVRRDNPVIQAYAGANQSICESQSALVTGNQVPQGATGRWDFVSGPVPATITTFGTFGSIAGMTQPGTYLFSWTILSNTSCPNSVSVVSITRVARPTIAQAPANQTVCGTTATIVGNTPTQGTGAWTYISGPVTPNLTQQGTTATVSGMNLSGSYRFRWTISNMPCQSSSAEVTIITTPGTMPGTLSGGGTVCSDNNNGTLVLNGYQGTIVRWEVSTDNFATFSLAQNNTHLFNFFNLNRTTSYRAVVKNGSCPEEKSNIATVVVNPATPQANGGLDQTICSNNVTLTGNTPQSGTASWAFQAGPVAPTMQTINSDAIITGMNVSGEYYFRYRIENEPCGMSEDVVKITVSAPTVAGTVSANQTFCSSNNTAVFTLAGHLGQVVRWEASTDNFGSIQPIANTTTSLRVNNVSQTTWYRAVVKNGTCAEAFTAPVSVTIQSIMQADAGSDVNICGNTLTLNGNDPMNGMPMWSWVSGPNQPSINQNGFTANVTGMVPGVYQFKYSISMPGCTPTSDIVQVTISGQAMGGQIAGGTSVCSGNNTGTLVVTGFNGNVVRWERSTNGWQSIEVIQNPTQQFTYINLTQTTQYRAVIASGACGEARSGDVTIFVVPVPTVANAGPAQTVCSGATVNLTGNAPQFGTPNWRFLAGPGTPNLIVSGNLLTVTNLNTVGTYSFEYSITSAPCTASVSNVTITVSGSPNSGTASGNATVCTGTNNGAITLTNQTGNIVRWESSTDNFVNVNPIANTTNVLGYVNLNTTTSYRAVVSRPGCPEMMSNVVTITVAQPSNGGTLTGTQNICNGNNNGALVLTNYVGTVLRWEISTNNFQSFNFVLANGNTFSYNNLTQTTQVRAVVKSGTCAEATSSVAVLTIDPTSIGGTLSADATVCHGNNSGTMALTGQRGNILRWEYSTDNWATVSTINNTAPTQVYANLMQTTGFRVVVKSGVCPEVTSNAVTITINPQSNAGMLAGTTTVCGFFNSANLNLSGNNGTIIRWESSTNNFQTVMTIAHTQNGLTVTNVLQTTRYRVVVQPTGNCPQTVSNWVEVAVLPAVQTGAITGPIAVCAPVNNGVLTLGGFVGNVVRWEVSTDNFQTFTTIANITNSYTFNNLTQTTQFRAFVGNGNCPPAPSSTWTIQVGTGTQAGTINGAMNFCGVEAQGTLTLTNFNGNVLRWESSQDNWQTITTINVTTPTYNYDEIFTTQFRAVVQSPGCAVSTTPPVRVIVDQVPSSGALYREATVCYEQNGDALYLIGTVGRIVRWESSTDNFQTIVTIPNTFSYLNYTGLTETTTYRAIAITGGVCPEAYSNEITITVRPQIRLQASVSMGCNGTGNIITRAEGGGGEYTYNIFPNIQPGNTSGDFINLPPNTYTVMAIDGFNCSNTITVTLGGNPSAPQISSVTNVTTSSGIVNWQPVPPGTGVLYTLRYRVLGSQTWTQISNLTATQFFLTALQHNTTYEVQLAYRCNANAPLSDFSTDVVNRFTTQSAGDCFSQTVPPPGGFFVNNITRTTAQLNWNTIPGAVAYVVSYGLATQNPNTWTQIPVCSPANTVLLTSLAANTTYRARIRSNCTQCGFNLSDRLSAWSLNVEFTTPNIREDMLTTVGINDLSVYPNPTRGDLNVSFSTETPEPMTLKLMDAHGKAVWSQHLEAQTGNNDLHYTLNGLASGIYLLQVSKGSLVQTTKVVIE